MRLPKRTAPELTTEKQDTESGPFEMDATRKPQMCYRCKKPIEVGQQFFTIDASSYYKRHTTCARHSTRKDGGQAGAFHGDDGRVIRGTNSC